MANRYRCRDACAVARKSRNNFCIDQIVHVSSYKFGRGRCRLNEEVLQESIGREAAASSTAAQVRGKPRRNRFGGTPDEQRREADAGDGKGIQANDRAASGGQNHDRAAPEPTTPQSNGYAIDDMCVCCFWLQRRCWYQSSGFCASGIHEDRSGVPCHWGRSCSHGHLSRCTSPVMTSESQPFVCCDWLRGNCRFKHRSADRCPFGLHDDLHGVSCNLMDECVFGHKERCLPAAKTIQRPLRPQAQARAIKDAWNSQGSDPWSAWADPWSRSLEKRSSRHAEAPQGCAEDEIRVFRKAGANDVSSLGETDTQSQIGSVNGSIAGSQATSQTPQHRRKCSRCSELHSVGTFDWISRHWLCVACGFDALDEYPESQRELANHIRFLRQHAIRHPDDEHSHSSFLGYHDSTCFCGKFNFPLHNEDIILKYCEAVAFFYKRHTPVFHMEFTGRGPRTYCEDIDVLCTGGPPQQESVLTDEFMSIRMAIMADTYPTVQPLKVHVYRSSGISRKYGHWKISVHLVWPQLVVDEMRAVMLRQHVVETLDMLCNPEARVPASFNPCLASSRQLVADIAEAHRHLDTEGRNTWARVFDSSVVAGGNGLRVPLSDKRDRPLSGQQGVVAMKEGRPKEPIGTWQFNRTTNRATCVMMRHQVSGGDATWVHLGLCRCLPNTELTDWRPPILKQPLQSRQERFRHSGSNGDSAAGLGRGLGIRRAPAREWRSSPPRVQSPQQTSEIRRENWRIPRPSGGSPSGDSAAGLGRRFSPIGRDTALASFSWLGAGPAKDGADQIISLWHDGCRDQNGIAAAVAISLSGSGTDDSHVVFSGHTFLAGQFTAPCCEYLSFLLGARELARHLGDVARRRVFFIGDSRLIQEHMCENAAEADVGYLLPLMRSGHELLERIGASSNEVEIHVVNRRNLAFVEKTARATLRKKTSSLRDHGLVTLFKKVEQMSQKTSDQKTGCAHSELLLTKDSLLRIVEGGSKAIVKPTAAGY